MNRLFAQGQVSGAANSFYVRDHIGSVREFTDGSGSIQADLSFDPWGCTGKLSGSSEPEVEFAGYFALTNEVALIWQDLGHTTQP